MAAQERISEIERKVASVGGVLAGAALLLRVIIGPDPQVAALTTVVIVVGLTFLAAGLRTRLARAGQGMFGNVIMIAWAIQGTLAFVRFALQAAPALSEAAAPMADAFAVASAAMLSLLWICISMMAAMAALGGSRSGQLPRWYVGSSAVAAVLFAVGVFGLLNDGGYLSWSGEVQTHLLYLAAAWYLAGGIAMWRPAD